MAKSLTRKVKVGFRVAMASQPFQTKACSAIWWPNLELMQHLRSLEHVRRLTFQAVAKKQTLKTFVRKRRGDHRAGEGEGKSNQLQHLQHSQLQVKVLIILISSTF